jgi:hypothetical protein
LREAIVRVNDGGRPLMVLDAAESGRITGLR